VGPLAGRRRQREIDDALDRLGRQRRFAGRTCLIAQEPVHAFLHEALLPAPDDRLRKAGATNDLQRSAALGGGQDHASARSMLLWCVAIPDDQLQTAAILGSDFDDDACSHIESLNQTTAFGNPPNASLH